MRILAICFLFLIFTAPQALALEERSLDHDGHKRLFYVHVPEQVKGQADIPTVLVFHGGGGSAEGMADMVRMEKTADKYGFMVVYPEGIGSKLGKFHTWNAGKCCAKAAEENIDDVGFVSKMIDQLVTNDNADPKRVYATGHSNGGMISYRLACELSDKIAAIAPNGGQDQKRETCPLTRPVPVLHIHGKADNCAPYEGGDQCGGCFETLFKSIGLPFKQERRSCEPVEDMTAQWAQFNGCSAQTVQSFQKGDVACNSYTECDGNAEVTLCAVENAGHSWPGQEGVIKPCERRPNGRICSAWQENRGPVNTDISANEFIWQFFAKHKIR